MNCPNCGNHLSDTAKFCTKCGFKISAQGRPPVQPANIRNEYGGNAGMQQPAPAPKKKSGIVTVLIVVFALLLVAGIGGGILYATGVLDGLTGGADSYAREEKSRRDEEEEEEETTEEETTEEETEGESGSDAEAAAAAETKGQLPVFVPVTGAASAETAPAAAETAPAAAGTSGTPAVPSYVYTPTQPSQAQNNTYQPQNNTYQPQNNTYQPQNSTYQPYIQPSFGTGYAGAGANTGASSGSYSGAYSGGAYGGYAGNGDYILPQSSSVPLTSADLYGLSMVQLRPARNEIYARHGRMFNDQTLQAYFNSKSWYRGTIAPSAFKDDAMLTKLERDNIKLIQSFE